MIPYRTTQQIVQQNLSVESSLRAALFKSTTEYSPDPSVHEFVSDVFDNGTTGAEFDGVGYGRVDVTNVQVTIDAANNRVSISADDVTFQNVGDTNGGQTIEALMIYKQIGGDDTTPGDDPIIRILDDSTQTELPQVTNGTDVIFTLSPIFDVGTGTIS